MVDWTYTDFRLTAFATYGEYLQSKLWKNIRRKVYERRGRTCWACKKAATLVHHADYREQTMTGDDIDGLYPLCRRCHKTIHRRRSLAAANAMMHQWNAEKSVKKVSRRKYKAMTATQKADFKKTVRCQKRMQKIKAQMARDRHRHSEAASKWS